jgi:hypothetical protein
MAGFDPGIGRLRRRYRSPGTPVNADIERARDLGTMLPGSAPFYDQAHEGAGAQRGCGWPGWSWP